MKKIFGDYYMGIDAGTSSIGWAVTDDKYNVLKFNGKAMWGIRLFEEGNSAEERRLQRTARRRTARKVQRIKLLQELFSEEISKRDPGFFMRLDESKYFPEDKTEFQKNALFNDKDFTDKDYHKNYHTIYHLRKAFVDGEDIKDVRLLYLALHHILCNRGHFLFYGMNLQAVTEFETSFSAMCEYMRDEFDYDTDLLNSEKLKDALKAKIGITAKKKELYAVFNDKRPFVKAAADLLAGSANVKLSALFDDETIPKEAKISFSSSDYDEKHSEAADILQDRIIFVDCLKAVYDWAVLTEILAGHRYISYAKVECFNKHGEDLELLKDTIRKHCPERYAEMFKDPKVKDNYCAYSGMCKKSGRKQVIEKKVTQEVFYKKVRSVLSDVDKEDPAVAQILSEIESETFMPKQTSKNNSVIPYQVNEDELKAILKNAERDFPFLTEKDESGFTVSQKILKLLTFRIPYYVGPLNDAHKDTGYCWIVKRSGESVTPWNFEKVVDCDASAENFITRMTNKCSYILGEDVLPKDSLLYSEFMMLNELNNLKLNGEDIKPEDKNNIISNLFMRKKKVKIKDIANYYKINGMEVGVSDFDGLDGDPKASLRSYIDFKNILGSRFDEDAVEQAIRAIVLFGADKKILVQRLKNIKDGYFTSDEIKSISGLKYSDWGRLSKKLLKEIYAVDTSTGEYTNIIGMLRSSSKNFMQILSSEYQFKENIDKYNSDINGERKEFTYDALVKDLYVSPKVKRSIWQMLLVVKEIEKITGHPPKKIFMEMTREDREKVPTKSRRTALLELYKKCGKETKELRESLEKFSDSDLRRDTLYLYYTQMERCMYSGEEIGLDEIFDRNIYDIDHIYPQSKTKDDSLNNRVLVKKVLNAKKGDNDLCNVADKVISPKARELWKVLKANGLITEEKYKRLTRKTPLSVDELSQFIARQIVETSQSTKATAEILQELYPDTRLVYSKASNVNTFKYYFGVEKGNLEFYKVREINDYHHARDAYLNIVVGNAFDVKFTKNPSNFIKSGEKYSLNEVMYKYDIRRGKETAWVAGENGTLATVKKVCGKENMQFTRYPHEATGALFDVQLVKKGKGQLPAKLSDKHMQGYTNEEWIAKYGGYNKVAGAYFFLVEHEVKGKRIRTLETMPMYCAKMIEKDPSELERYVNEVLKLQSPDIRLRKIKFDSLFNCNGALMHITGRTNDSIVFKLAIQLRIPKEQYVYAKKIVKFINRQIEMKQKLKVTPFDKITVEENISLYNLFLNKLQNKPYSNVSTFKTYIPVLSEQADKFVGLPPEQQAELLYQIMHFFQCNRIETDLSVFGATSHAGNLFISKKISNWDKALLINQSVTGLFEQTVDLKTV